MRDDTAGSGACEQPVLVKESDLPGSGGAQSVVDARRPCPVALVGKIEDVVEAVVEVDDVDVHVLFAEKLGQVVCERAEAQNHNVVGPRGLARGCQARESDAKG